MMLVDAICARSQFSEMLPKSHAALRAQLTQAERFEIGADIAAVIRKVRDSPAQYQEEALPLCRMPFQSCWFEWVGPPAIFMALPNAAPATDRKPVPDRMGCLVQVDGTMRRGTITWAWSHRDKGVNVAPISIAFDWSDDFVEVPCLSRTVRRAHGLPEFPPEFYRDPQAAQIERIERRCGFQFNTLAGELREVAAANRAPERIVYDALNSAIEDVAQETGFLKAMILVLNSRNIIQIEPAPDYSRLNKKRKTLGRPPLLSLSKVRIKISDGVARRAGIDGSDPAAVRAHIVRGHFKVRKTGVFWWSPFVRGDAAAGAVRKSYQVAA